MKVTGARKEGKSDWEERAGTEGGLLNVSEAVRRVRFWRGRSEVLSLDEGGELFLKGGQDRKGGLVGKVLKVLWKNE